MSETIGASGQGRQAEPIDLSVLERIEGELDAVERALEQIDQGVYDGFAGIGADSVSEAAPASPVEPDEGPAGYI